MESSDGPERRKTHQTFVEVSERFEGSRVGKGLNSSKTVTCWRVLGCVYVI